MKLRPTDLKGTTTTHKEGKTKEAQMPQCSNIVLFPLYSNTCSSVYMYVLIHAYMYVLLKYLCLYTMENAKVDYKITNWVLG